MAKAGKRKPKSVKLTAREYKVLSQVSRIKGVPVSTLMRTWSLARAREFLKDRNDRAILQPAAVGE